MTISLPRDHSSRVVARRSALAGQIILGLVGLAFMFALVYQYLEVYFTIGTVPLKATPGDGARYLWTASFAVAIPLACAVLAILRRRVVAFIAAFVLLVGMLGLAFVLAVPQGRWMPTPEVNHLPADYVPCFSGSGTCRGG